MWYAFGLLLLQQHRLICYILQNNRTLNVPSTAVVSGNCSNKSSEMTLSWSESDKNNTMNTITFHIGKNETNFFVYQVAATVYYNKDGMLCHYV